jgi:hypothetical protein
MMSRTIRVGRAQRAIARLIGIAIAAASCARSPAAVSPNPAAVPQAQRTDPTNGVDVIRAMHDRYASVWYRTLTFSQTTTITLPNGGSLQQQWLEAGKFPGRLRIDTDTANRSGVIYAGDTVYRFTNGKLAAATADMNELLILGFDVYTQPVARTVEVLRGRGIDMAKLSRNTWEGRPVFVVGAVADDTLSKQFWIDAERLLFVRLVETVTTPTATRRADYRFLKYVPHGNAWVAEEVVGLRDGKPSLHEVYANVQVNVPLDDATFDPSQYATFTPWYRR